MPESRLDLDLQVVTRFPGVPHYSQLESWVSTALQGRGETAVTIRVVDEAQSSELNKRFRGKPGPTNVLSFAADVHEAVSDPLLGDIVICAPLVSREAQEQGINLMAHWAHLTVHGVLHLLGHDHQNEEQARQMEREEVCLLARIGYPDPYQSSRS